jgi:DNA-binding response OmpR family regulator
MKILIVEDDRATREILARAIASPYCDVMTASTGLEVQELVQTAIPDLILLDVMLPDIDGFEVCRRIRLDSQIPVIMMTSCDDEAAVMRGFEVGADDYVTKPLSIRLLHARMAALLRRTGSTRQRVRSNHIHAGSFDVDVQNFEVRKDGQKIHLTPLEFRIFHILAANYGRVVPYERMFEFAWGHAECDRSLLKIRITGLRKKLHLSLDGSPIIKAVAGTGYSLRAS